MRTTTIIALLFACGVVQAGGTSNNAVHQRMAFMCEWVDGRYPDTSWRLRPCSAQGIAEATDAELNSAMEAFIQEYIYPRDAGRREFEKAYLRKYPHVYTESEIRPLSDERLCTLVRDAPAAVELASSELIRRTALSAREMDAVRARRINIGTSQKVLLCALGPPQRRNRTVTASGEDIQWVYGRTLIFYTVNGVVTAFQD
jgi:hypothetical protein